MILGGVDHTTSDVSNVAKTKRLDFLVCCLGRLVRQRQPRGLLPRFPFLNAGRILDIVSASFFWCLLHQLHVVSRGGDFFVDKMKLPFPKHRQDPSFPRLVEYSSAWQQKKSLGLGLLNRHRRRPSLGRPRSPEERLDRGPPRLLPGHPERWSC